jgi:signal transduction histidine kinase
MRGELGKHIEAVTELNQSLERKVAERTAELERALADLQASRAELVHVEKMASIGRLAAGVAHEINNPLNFIANSLPPLQAMVEGARAVLALHAKGEHAGAAAERASRKLDESLADVDDLLRLLRNGAQRTQEIVRGLRDFSRRDEGEPATSVDVAALLDETLALLRHELAGRVQVERDYAPDSTVTGRRGALAQLFMNLVANAAQAIPERGTITLATRCGADTLSLSVRDTGCGIPPEAQSKIFEPFYTTKAGGREHSGLGLAICQEIMKGLGGSLAVASGPERGTAFTLWLPLETENV